MLRIARLTMILFVIGLWVIALHSFQTSSAPADSVPYRVRMCDGTLVDNLVHSAGFVSGDQHIYLFQFEEGANYQFIVAASDCRTYVAFAIDSEGLLLVDF